jgi:uncharacterized iron-regulated membrane protein
VSLRRLLVRLHLWLGLTLGAVWALQGLTGAALVFHREMDRWGVEAASGPMAPVDRLIAAAERRAGGAIRMLGVADARGDVLNATYADGDGRDRTIRLEAATARVLDDRAGDAGWRRVYMLHEELLLHNRGATLIGLSGLLLASMALTGLWIGWPKRRGWRAALDPRPWRGRRAALYGWHRLSGLLVAVALVVIPLCGVAMAWRPSLWPLLERTTSFRPPFRPTGALPPAIVAPGAAWATAQRAFPDGRFVRITMPSAKHPAYHVRLLRPGELRAWSGTSSVTVDAGTGRLLARYDALAVPWPNRLYDAAFPVHNGEAAGVAGRLLVMLAGLSLPALYVTGLIGWVRKRRSRAVRPGIAERSALLRT